MLDKVLRKAVAKERGVAGTPAARSLGEYVQVSLKERPFGGDLGTPKGTLLPLRAPQGFTDEEIIEIVDFIRTNPEGVKRPNSVLHPERFNGSAPIIEIAISIVA